jgi:hypothetical protein
MSPKREINRAAALATGNMPHVAGFFGGLQFSLRSFITSHLLRLMRGLGNRHSNLREAVCSSSDDENNVLVTLNGLRARIPTGSDGGLRNRGNLID